MIGLEPKALDAGADHDEPLMVTIMVRGFHTPVLTEFVFELKERCVGRLPLGADVFYQYNKPMDSTLFIFKGDVWLFPLAKLVRLLETSIPLIIWSNWDLEFVKKHQQLLGTVNPEEGSSSDIPSVGYLKDVMEFIEEKMDVDVVPVDPEEVDAFIEDGIGDEELIFDALDVLAVE